MFLGSKFLESEVLVLKARWYDSKHSYTLIEVGENNFILYGQVVIDYEKV